ncbi:MAG: pyruvate formate lyase 1-activating protein, partial [Lachnospira sp.]|nr:pyruvate formate lyase 1-activating protein [Lachnospira sp.]
DGEEDLNKLSDFISSLKTIDRVEVLPYHTLGVFKWKELGIDYTLEGVSPPDGELIKKANDILKTSEYKGYLNRQ